MAQEINFYLIDAITRSEGIGWGYWSKVVLYLRSYVQNAAAKATNDISKAGVWWCPESYKPTLTGIDIVVYVVTDVRSSVIKHNGGDVSMPLSNPNLLGVTDLDRNISEIYYDRVCQGSALEVSGAVFHEAAHLKSRMDNSMHNGQNGFLGTAPDYNGHPTSANLDFFARNMGRAINQILVPVP